MKVRSQFAEAQRHRFSHSCASCLQGNHVCGPYDLFRFADGTLERCQCGCIIEPWPWPTGDETDSCSHSPG